MKHKIFIFYILSSLMLYSCTISQNHGYHWSKQNIDIKPGLTKESVKTLMGSPSLISHLQGESWYYINQNLLNKGFFTPKISSQEIMKISFQNGTIEKVKRLNNEDIHLVKFDTHYTVSEGDDTNLFREFLGNLGKYNVKPQLK